VARNGLRHRRHITPGIVGRRSNGRGTDDFAIYSSAQPYACFNDGETRLRFVRNVLRFVRNVLR